MVEKWAKGANHQSGPKLALSWPRTRAAVEPQPSLFSRRLEASSNPARAVLNSLSTVRVSLSECLSASTFTHFRRNKQVPVSRSLVEPCNASCIVSTRCCEKRLSGLKHHFLGPAGKTSLFSRLSSLVSLPIINFLCRMHVAVHSSTLARTHKSHATDEDNIRHC